MGGRGHQQITRFMRRGVSEGRGGIGLRRDRPGGVMDERGSESAAAGAASSSIAAQLGSAASAIGLSICL